VLDGPKSEIKERFKTNTYNIKYSGELLNTSADFEIINTEQIEHNYSSSTIKLNTGTPVNQLIRQIIDQVELRSFGENIPSMNDIFKMVVNESID
jgi:ABC-2 type transport system ATP-binding protein